MFRISMLVGVVTALMVAPAYASFGRSATNCCPCAETCGSPCATPCASPCAPAPCATRKILCTEYVPETYTCKKTCYRTECRTEKCVSYRCEYTTETRQRTVCSYERVCETKTVMRKKCVTTPCVEERTVMHTTWTTQMCTEMRCKKVDRGHYECREVYSPCKALTNRLSGCFGGHHHSCCSTGCDTCNTCPTECCTPPATRTVKVWVPCWETVQCPVQVCKKVCVTTPCVTKVTVCKHTWVEEPCTVTCYKCVPVSKVCNYTVCVPHQVAVEGTRTVSVCVPYETTYTACRMVARTVEKTVADTTCNSCNTCNSSNSCCTPARSGFLTGLCSRLGQGFQGHSRCHGSTCSSCGCN